MVKGGVKFSYNYLFAFEIEKYDKKEIKYIIKINPEKFINDLKEDFDEYIHKLKSSSEDSDIIKNFKKMLPELHGKFDVLIKEFSGVEK